MGHLSFAQFCKWDPELLIQMVFISTSRLGCHLKLVVFEAKFLARLCSYLKRYRQTWLLFIYLIHEEDTGSFDPKINVLPLGL